VLCEVIIQEITEAADGIAQFQQVTGGETGLFHFGGELVSVLQPL
jgi:hypothetical protein